ncbi:MAG TPA: MFS transporter, partial [Thermomicrobiales bacterium]|nr:MFS transporter [Thermomicrobiales bacterium]
TFALATGFGTFFLACAFWSVASGLSGAAPVAYAADIAPPGMNAAAMSNYRLIADMGYIAGPLLLGAATDAWSAPTALVLAAAMSVVAGVSFGIVAPETKPKLEPSAVSHQSAAADRDERVMYKDEADASIGILETGAGRVGDSA